MPNYENLNISIIFAIDMIMKRLFILFALVPALTFGQVDLDPNKEYMTSIVGFYNLENLFDTLDSEDTWDAEFLPTGERTYNSEKYYEKLDNMAHVISLIGTDFHPDGCAVLGVSEVENKNVMDDLVLRESIAGRNYQVVHYQSPDERGIDVGLIYNPTYFTLLSSSTYFVTLPDTSDRTRDQLLVTGEMNGERIHIIVAHWPSRSGGEKRSEPNRAAAADVGRTIVDSIMAAEPNAKIFYMGDLNDDPTNISVEGHLMATNKINKAKGSVLFNTTGPLFKEGIGTLAWQDTWNLFDQIIITPSLIRDDYSEWSFFKTKVFNESFLIQSSGAWKGYPFRTYSGSTWQGGYSDHFPVYTILLKEQ